MANAQREVIGRDHDFGNARSAYWLASCGIGVDKPSAPILQIGTSDSDARSTSIKLSRTGEQAITKTGGGMSLVVPDSSSFFNVVMGTTSKIKVEPGITGGASGVFTLNNSGGWTGTLAHWPHGETIITQQPVDVGGSQLSILHVIGGAITNVAAGPGSPDVLFALARNVGHVAGDLTNRRAVSITAPTWDFAAASVVTQPATVSIGGAPTPGTNATFKNTWALLAETGDVGLLTGRLRLPPRTDADQSKPSLTFMASMTAGDGYAGGPKEQTGFYWYDSRPLQFFAIVQGGISARFTALGVLADNLQTTTLRGGDFDGRTDASPLSIYGGASTTARGLTIGATGTFTATSGTQSGAYFTYTGPAGAFAPTSGTAAWRGIDLSYEINQTGGANGAITGLRLGFTRTAVGGTHLPFDVTADSGGSSTGSLFSVYDGGTSPVASIGAAGTGYTGYATLNFFTNIRSGYLILDNATNNFVVGFGSILFGPSASLGTWDSSGLLATSLAGTGSSLLQASSTGLISRAGTIGSILGLTGPAVVWTNGSGDLQVDTTNFVWDATNHVLTVGAGSATHPGVNFAGSTTSGLYAYSTNIAAISSNGKPVAVFDANTTAHTRYLALGISGDGDMTGAATMIFQTLSRQAQISLDNATGNVLSVNVPWWLPNGSASAPSLAFSGSPTTGIFRYSAGTLGLVSNARTLMILDGNTTANTIYVSMGYGDSGITGATRLQWFTASRSAILGLDNSSNDFSLTGMGSVTIGTLAGTGTRTVVASSSGLLGARSLPTFSIQAGAKYTLVTGLNGNPIYIGVGYADVNHNNADDFTVHSDVTLTKAIITWNYYVDASWDGTAAMHLYVNGVDKGTIFSVPTGPSGDFGTTTISSLSIGDEDQVQFRLVDSGTHTTSGKTITTNLECGLYE